MALEIDASEPCAACWIFPGVAVLQGDKRGRQRAQQQRHLDRPVESVQAEDGQRSGDQNDEYDERNDRVGQRRRSHTRVIRAR